jgi:hypothetical protein
MKCGGGKMLSGCDLKTRVRVNTIPHYHVHQEEKVRVNIYMPNQVIKVSKFFRS